ncbi:MAG: hypothetical protein BGO10_07720 [Chlamydia sp. 32-24]|nr:MAG: hypothetical protein BGO10_07720 [Chlamydia sp. 32-24]
MSVQALGYVTPVITNSSYNTTTKISVDNKILRYEASKLNLKNKMITFIDSQSKYLDHRIPNNLFQRKVDHFFSLIEKIFKPLGDWIDKNEGGHWFKQLAIFLAKLPLKVGKNLLTILYKIVHTAFYAPIHPLQAITKMEKLIVELVFRLIEPETWSSIGAGMIGFSAGQFVVGNPISVIGFLIGGVCLLSGLSFGTLLSALKAEKNKVKEGVLNHLKQHAKTCVESMLTSFVLGLIIGAIQKAIYKEQTTDYRINSQEDAKKFADDFMKNNNLPTDGKVTLHSDGSVTIEWKGIPEKFKKFSRDYGIHGYHNPSDYEIVYDKVSLKISPTEIMEFHDFNIYFTKYYPKFLRAQFKGVPQTSAAFKYTYPIPPMTENIAILAGATFLGSQRITV